MHDYRLLTGATSPIHYEEAGENVGNLKSYGQQVGDSTSVFRGWLCECVQKFVWAKGLESARQEGKEGKKACVSVWGCLCIHGSLYPHAYVCV